MHEAHAFVRDSSADLMQFRRWAVVLGRQTCPYEGWKGCQGRHSTKELEHVSPFLRRHDVGKRSLLGVLDYIFLIYLIISSEIIALFLSMIIFRFMKISFSMKRIELDLLVAEAWDSSRSFLMFPFFFYEFAFS